MLFYKYHKIFIIWKFAPHGFSNICKFFFIIFIIALMRFLHCFLKILVIMNNDKWPPARILFWKPWNGNPIINFAWPNCSQKGESVKIQLVTIVYTGSWSCNRQGLCLARLISTPRCLLKKHAGVIAEGKLTRVVELAILSYEQTAKHNKHLFQLHEHCERL